jgi:tRNA(fMet)-specific endonuclease VapC
MTDYILDTNTCIYWLKGKEEIRRKVKEVGADHLKTTMITLAELRYGAYNSQKVKENLKNIDNFLRKVEILPLHEEATDIFGKLKVELRRIGKMIEDFDILIASITLSHGGILVTNNVEHFKNIGGLSYENWLGE